MRRKAGSGEGRSDDEGAGALEIEFEDGEESAEGDSFASAPAVDAGRSRDLRGAALTLLAVVTLGAAFSATHHVRSSDTERIDVPVVAIEPDYAAYMVTVSYQGSRVVSLEQRRITVDLRITPVPGARVRVLAYYVTEAGVLSETKNAPPSDAPLPASGVKAELELTVQNCTVAPIGESMSFVNVVSQGPVGVEDRFTILGERFAADLERLMLTVCPTRSVAGGAG